MILECSDEMAFRMSSGSNVKKVKEGYTSKDEFLAVIEGMLSKDHDLYKQLDN